MSKYLIIGLNDIVDKQLIESKITNDQKDHLRFTIKLTPKLDFVILNPSLDSHFTSQV